MHRHSWENPINGVKDKKLPEANRSRGKQMNCEVMRDFVLIDSKRVIWGGSWDNNARNCRLANQNNNSSGNRNNNLGFRLVLSPAHPRGW